MAEVGDNLAPGGVCVTLLDTDPMLFAGQVPEASILAVKEGMKATVELVGSAQVDGTVRYIAPAADASTRTFGIEVAIDNAEGIIRDGLTAEAVIPLAPTQAYKLESAWLTLADDGEVGVRAVDADNKVKFHPITILAQEETGVWAAGLEPGLKVITLGQNFVAAGETVDPVPADAAAAAAGEGYAAAAEFVIENHSKRMGDALRDEMDERGTPEPKEGENAKSEVIANIRTLESNDEIKLVFPDE